MEADNADDDADPYFGVHTGSVPCDETGWYLPIFEDIGVDAIWQGNS
jgi:hypothetical protein